MAYIVEQDYPDGGEQFIFTSFKKAMQKARKLNKQFIDRIFIYYQRKDKTFADAHWVIYPEGKTCYEC